MTNAQTCQSSDTVIEASTLDSLPITAFDMTWSAANGIC